VIWPGAGACCRFNKSVCLLSCLYLSDIIGCVVSINQKTESSLNHIVVISIFILVAYPGRKRRYWSAAGKQLPKPGPLKSVPSELGDPLRVIFQRRRHQIGTQAEKKDRHLGMCMASHKGLEIHLSRNLIAWKLRVVLPRFQLHKCRHCTHLLPLRETCKILRQVGAHLEAHKTHSLHTTWAVMNKKHCSISEEQIYMHKLNSSL